MLVTLIGKNSMNKLVLPREVAGNYWLYDKNYDQSKRLINIESVGNNWQIKLLVDVELSIIKIL